MIDGSDGSGRGARRPGAHGIRLALLAGATVMACAGPAAFFRDAGGVLGADEIPPVTTTFADAYPEDVNNVVPTGLVFRPMAELARSPRGGFYLAPGAYEMRAQSYCLHAGTHA